MKTKAIIVLAIVLIVYLGCLYSFVSIGNKSFDYHKWSIDGGQVFGAFACLGVVVCLILTGGILSNEIKIKK